MNTDTEIDLDIDNYDLNDLLRLFHLDIGYGRTELANAKRMVLKMHPDKSRMDPKYFLFYSKAYKTLYQLWTFRNVQTDSNVSNSNIISNGQREHEPKVYVSDTGIDRDTSGNGELLDRMFRNNSELRKVPEFNRWFNAEFEKARVGSTDEEGYGEWLVEECNNVPSQQGSTGQMMAAFTEKKRQACQDVVVHKEVEAFYGGLGGSMGSDLGGSEGGVYDSTSNSGGIAYQDLRKAHTETMIPVSDADLARRKAFGSVDEMRRYRTGQDTTPLSETESRQQLSNQSAREDENAIRRAYRLTKEVEESERKSQQFWKNLRMLKDK